jgi:hypothetical protein
MKIEIYNLEKSKAIRLAKKNLANVKGKNMLKMAIDLGVSINTIHSYRSGTGSNFETAIKINEYFLYKKL